MTAAILAGAGMAPTASAAPVLQATIGFARFGGSGSYTVGWAFTTNDVVTVTALANSNLSEVRLYDASLNILASATTLATDPVHGISPALLTHAIAPVDLAANTTYYIAADHPAATGAYFSNLTNIVTDPRITYDHPTFAIGGGLLPTTDGVLGQTGDGNIGPSFEIAALPEPASLSLLGVGVFCLLRRPTRFMRELGE